MEEPKLPHLRLEARWTDTFQGVKAKLQVGKEMTDSPGGLAGEACNSPAGAFNSPGLEDPHHFDH